MILLVLLLAAAVMPAAEYSTYIGDQNTWQVTRLLTDPSGNTYVAGGRTFNLVYDPLRPDLATEAIVAKLDATGKTTLFAGIGGKGSEVARALAVDRSGNIYIAGSTSSPNFPVRRALYTTPGRGFIVKYNSDASDVLWATYFPETVVSMAIDGDGAVYVAGTTYSKDFPATAGLPKGPVSFGAATIISGAFLTKIAASGDKIVYSTIISGTQKNCGAGSSCFTSSRGASAAEVAVDGAGNAYLAGNSDVTDLPTTPGVVTPAGAGAFVAKINASGTSLGYLTYIGTGGITFSPYFTPANRIRAMAVDTAGNAFVTGYTFDPKLPFQNKFHGWTEIQQGVSAPPGDVFAAKLNPAGAAFVWGSYLGGDDVDDATAAALDSAGNFWVAGATKSTSFPNVDGWSTGGDYLVKFDSTGATPYAARYPGGTIAAVGVDPAGLLHVASSAGVVSAIAATSTPVSRPWVVGPFGGQISAGEVIEIYGPHIGGAGQKVYFNDIAAPILYSGDQQINVVVPFEIEGQTTARVRIGSGPEFSAAVLDTIPQIYWPALNQDGTINSRDNPAKVGSVMTIWVTGTPPPFPAVPNGYIPTAAQTYVVGNLYADGQQVRLFYAGAAPGLIAGVSQINFAAPNSSTIVLTAGHYASAAFPIYVAP